jgi:hypothetical protein
MTDRVFALTVTLSESIRDDNAQPIIDAIMMIKGVVDVVPLIADAGLYVAQERAREQLAQALWNVLYPDSK